MVILKHFIMTHVGQDCYTQLVSHRIKGHSDEEMNA